MSRFEKLGDQTDDFGRKSVDGHEGVLDVHRLLMDVQDSRNRITDLW